MIKLPQSSLLRTEERAISLNGTAHVEEGKFLVFDGFNENGERTVKYSAGADGEQFAGVALSDVGDVSSLNFYDDLVADDLTLTLPHEPTAGTLTLKIEGVPLVVTTDYTIAGKVVTLVGAGKTDATVAVSYAYAPSYSEVVGLQGDVTPADLTNVLGRTGVIEAGVVYTSCFDPTVDWAAVTPATVGLGANGLLTTVAKGGEAPTKPIHIVAIPTNGNPFLGVSF